MKLAMETNYLRKVYGSVGAFRMIKEAGFDAADVSLYNLPEDDDFINRPDRRDYALSLREEADKLGLTFCQAHAAFKYKFGEPRDSKAYTDIIRSMEFASYLGVPHIIVHSTKCPRNDFTLDTAEYYADFYRSLEPYCEEYGIKVAVENLFIKDKICGCFRGVNGTPAEMNRVMDKLNPAHFITCLDVGHAALTGCEPEDFIAGMSNDRLLALHIQDNDHKDDRHWLPHLGELNWDKITEALGKIDYKGDFTLEIIHYIDRFGVETIPAALRLAADTGRELMAKVESARLR